MPTKLAPAASRSARWGPSPGLPYPGMTSSSRLRCADTAAAIVDEFGPQWGNVPRVAILEVQGDVDRATATLAAAWEGAEKAGVAEGQLNIGPELVRSGPRYRLETLRRRSHVRARVARPTGPSTRCPCGSDVVPRTSHRRPRGAAGRRRALPAQRPSTGTGRGVGGRRRRLDPSRPQRRRSSSVRRRPRYPRISRSQSRRGQGSGDDANTWDSPWEPVPTQAGPLRLGCASRPRSARSSPWSWRALRTRKIGRRLFISPRTAQSHLAHVFTKLRMSSRVELATQAPSHLRPGPAAPPSDARRRQPVAPHSHIVHPVETTSPTRRRSCP